VLDLFDPARPALAEHRADVPFNPGSVGKLMVATALFQRLADLYPDDIAARERVLREARVVADGFIVHDAPLSLCAELSRAPKRDVMLSALPERRACAPRCSARRGAILSGEVPLRIRQSFQCSADYSHRFYQVNVHQ
jgi:hypothetical protein